MTSAMQAVWPARSSIACAQGVHAAPRVLDTWVKAILVTLIALAFILALLAEHKFVLAALLL